MDAGFGLFRDRASTMAAAVDPLSFLVIAVSAFFALVVAVAVVVRGVRCRRRHDGGGGPGIEGLLALELAWSVIPTILAMVMLGWGASVYYKSLTPRATNAPAAPAVPLAAAPARTATP